MSKPGELLREPPPANETPDVIYLPPPANDPAPKRKNGRAISTKPGSQISRRPKVKDPRDARLDIRCRAAIRAKAEACAEAAGISVAGYVEALIDGAPGPRVHRNPSEQMKLLAQIRAERGKQGSNLNQCGHGINEIRIIASEGAGRDRLTELLEAMYGLYCETIREHRATNAQLEYALGLRPDDDDY